MSKSKLVFLLLIALVPLACGAPGWIASAPSMATAPTERSLMAVAAVDSTATATPFLPLPPTPTYLPTFFPTPTEVIPPTPLPTEPPAPTEAPEFEDAISKGWNDYPGPTVWPDIVVPAPTGLLAQPAGQVNILLLGSDQRTGDPGFRTDTILLVTLNPKEGTANITSFPRDLYVYIPGWTVQRVNTAHAHGGFETTALTFEYNFGVRPDYFVMINFSSFREIIDSLDGITVEVMNTLCDHRDNYGDVCIYSGLNEMDGETALWYVRSRYSSSDFDRGRRQQEVIQGLFDKLISLDALARAPELYQIYQNNVTTNMSFEDMAALVPLAAKLASDPQIQRYNISPKHVIHWVNSYGAQVLLPIREAILDIMRQALNSPD